MNSLVAKTKVIAFYLPQFHPIPENDIWWGKGFTEWTNVGKAKPLFRGHNQPRVPADLGYYDLRMPIVREQQVELAKEAGITAFCYWHYWFGNGKRLMADIFDEVLNTNKPDFPFCLAWANHSWFAKNWNSDGTSTNKLLMEQTYLGIEDEKLHFDFLLKAFKDHRYVKIGNRPFLFIFDPVSIPDEYIRNFKQWAKDVGFDGLYLVANITTHSIRKEELLNRGFDAVTYQRLGGIGDTQLNRFSKMERGFLKLYKYTKAFVLRRPPRMVDYKKYHLSLITEEDKLENVLPSIVPQWDHTPRSGWNGSLFINSTPELFYDHVLQALNATKDKSTKIILVKSWNEWGEGNYMEPDLKYGKGYIEALKAALDSFEDV
ncbi:glycosyltransferase WbsX family protein [Bacteroides reticulotermitis]|uniref:Glycosyltransferase n=2 Tax=Bacteroides reticulotermitis TaxID=1133319 RepID=W4UZF3_9BACE|nr:glycoside hydrolase family 99-like domain-containing protein [Bacteroides reticulotermitis]MBB4045534.1 lipopolysaccharide biosynthesis protein [Bacteroides reticulotermitis]GAE86645.1 glycosyltransferase [Bacteroides reticulotermitis JCM 10512]